MDDQQRQRTLQAMGLFVLLDRAGGSVSFSEAEYHEALERWGGRTVATIHVEHSKTGDRPDRVELSLARRPPIT